MSTAFMEVRQLVKKFGPVAAVDGVSFVVERGEVLTLLGPSGCGKTTTLRCVAGFERPDGGEILIKGQTFASAERRTYLPPEKRGLGMVFQSYAVWPHMTVFENVAYPLVIRRRPAKEVRSRVEETLSLVGLGGFESRSAMLLSGGQQQRVALARALVYSPDILLLDEPLSNLDAKLRGQMRIELKRLQEQLDVTVLFVTHDQLEAMSLSTHLAVMNQGRIEQMGSPQEIYERPATPFVEGFLGQVLRIPARVVENQWSGGTVTLEGVPESRIQAVVMDDGLAVGQSVLVGIRPEEMEVRPARDGAGPNLVQCEVEKVIYLGADCELLLRIGERTYTLPVPRATALDLGRTAELRFDPEHMRVWAAERAAAVMGDEDADVGPVGAAAERTA